MWWITIIVDIALVFLGFVFCSNYYSRHYEKDLGYLSLQFLQMYEIVQGRVFGVMPNFSNFSYNILLKGIITIICILVIHFTDSLWITYLYMPYLFFTYWVFKRRVQHYMEQPNESKTMIKPALVASFTLPFIHTLFLALLYVTYLFN